MTLFVTLYISIKKQIKIKKQSELILISQQKRMTINFKLKYIDLTFYINNVWHDTSFILNKETKYGMKIVWKIEKKHRRKKKFIPQRL